MRAARRIRHQSKWERGGGLAAVIAIGLFGLLLGGGASFFLHYGSTAEAYRAPLAPAALRDHPEWDRSWRERVREVERLEAEAAAGFAPLPQIAANQPEKPKIIIVFDDMGLSRAAFDAVMAMPGPLTLSFLPYGEKANEMAREARRAGLDVMLHLPMEPVGPQDPGPNALMSNMTGAEFLKTLRANLNGLDGYIGVNNHMGSKLTADEAAMKTLLANLSEEGLFFLDSVTTGQSAVRRAAGFVGAEIYSRDVFIDATSNDRSAVRAQLSAAERIALQTGYVVAIAHPRKVTIEEIEPWLITAKARGFELAPISALGALERARKLVPIAAQAPTLRG